MTDDTFICLGCQRIFPYTRPKEEALEEARKRFPEVPVERLVPVCPDCARRINEAMAARGK